MPDMPSIPFVIDNQQHIMSSVLNDLLAQHTGHSLDIATAYFNVAGGNCCARGWVAWAIFGCCWVTNPQPVLTWDCARAARRPAPHLL